MLKATIYGHYVLAGFLIVDGSAELALHARLLRQGGERLLAIRWLRLLAFFCLFGTTRIVKVESRVVEGLGEATS